MSSRRTCFRRDVTARSRDVILTSVPSTRRRLQLKHTLHYTSA